jgi:NADH-quinone oxidoreductase subunit K
MSIMTDVIMQTVLIGVILFMIGLVGVILNRSNLLVMLMSIELMLLAVNIILIVYSIVLDDILGQLFSLFVLGVAGAESAIGLAILVSYYRKKGTLSLFSTHS